MRYSHLKNKIKTISREYILPDRTDAKWMTELILSLIAPACILIFRPLGLDMRQSGVIAGVLLAIILWSTDIVKKIPTSIFLLAVFCLVNGAGVEKVFSFPLSDTFPMLVVTYLFSQAILNAGILEKVIEPVLFRLVHTPVQCIAATVIVFFLMVYVIPQPLARLIIVAAVFDRFLKKTNLSDETRSVLMYGVFLFYAVVNMSSKDADMIMNHVAAEYSETEITNWEWIQGMFIPTVLVCLVIILLFVFLFRKQLTGYRISVITQEKREKTVFSRQQKTAAVIMSATVILWMTSGLHGLNNTVVTLVAVICLFGVKVLKPADFRAVDVTTLIFLTAAFSIGGVMEACGAADKVFGLFKNVFPDGFSTEYVLIMVGISMAPHMILGSNTTTLSVVVPGMMILCGQYVPSPVIVYVAVISVSFHAILPFHSVSMMIGESDGYFPSRYVTSFGVPATFLVYATVIVVYIPYWKLTGIL